MNYPDNKNTFPESTPITQYFFNYKTEREYISKIEELKSTISQDELLKIAEKHFNQFNTIRQYYLFFRAWKVILGPENLYILGQEIKETLLKNISEEVYSAKENACGILKLINLILSFLNIQDELQQEKTFLNQQFENFASTYICNYCQNTGMQIYEDTLVCPVCGFSRVF